jgi:hypothetical protein
MPTPLTQRHILRLWLPLAAMWLLMSLEQPTLSAVIARLPEPTLNLAAYGLTFALALIVESPVIMFLTLGTALARSRQAYQMLMRFTHIMAWGLTGFHLLLGLSPLYAWILAELVGAPPEVIEPSRIAFLLMAPWSGAIAYRRMWQGGDDSLWPHAVPLPDYRDPPGGHRIDGAGRAGQWRSAGGQRGRPWPSAWGCWPMPWQPACWCGRPCGRICRSTSPMPSN